MCEFVWIETIAVGEVWQSTIIDQELNDQKMTMLSCDVQWSILQSLSLLIDILTLSNENSAHVEVSIFTGSPDMLECMLRAITLT